MPVHVFETIIRHIGNVFNILPNAEITIEANPGTITNDKIDDFITAGLTRISIGVQALTPARLEYLGRIHTVRDAMNIVNYAMGTKLRVSADFIYGLPGDTIDTVTTMCHQINQIGLTHCSMYELTIEPGTPLAATHPKMPSNDDMAQMYNTIGEQLSIPRYEVSNYAVPGFECRHNQNVWAGEPYIGIGRGAAGRINIDGIWYEQMGNNQLMCPMDPSTRAIEKIITGMRTRRGIQLTNDVITKINMDFIDKNPLYFIHDKNHIAATDCGILILDKLLVNMVR